MKRPKDIPAKTREAVKARSGGICEGCGRRRASEIHHRRYKSRGGGHELSNLLHLCGSGNHTGCHGTAHTEHGERLGWSVESGVSAPSAYLVEYRDVRGWLDDEGGFSPVGAAYRMKKGGA